VALALVSAASLLSALFLWRRSRSHRTGAVAAGANPFELGEAIRFGLLFGAVMIAAKAAEAYLGETGLYLAGVIGGLTDVDAISLSMANLVASDAGNTLVAARTIVIAVIANTLVKAGMASWMGTPAMRRTILPITGVLLIAAVAGVVLAGQLQQAIPSAADAAY
jgi:uncharacterized membrane protein (DUF4010 family)